MAFNGFDRAFFAFLKKLKTNNNREWFTEHKAQYQAEVEGPALAFVEAFAPRLKKISPRFVADPRRSGGSMFRIYRDTRFSHDKTPYKTHVGLHFWHDGAGLESPPSFYLHLSPGEIFGGGGCWHPDPVALRKIRLRIHDAPKEWKAVLATGMEIEGSTLKRVPAGFPSDHPFATDLMRKDHFASDAFTMADVATARFVDRYADTCAAMAPLMKFLTLAQEQKY
jgi:uncharacterized protein (TIGR02453 family)